MSRISNFIAGLIDPKKPADGAPPKSLYAFFGWGLKGAWPTIWLTVLAITIASSLEVISYYLLGRIVELASSAMPKTLWVDHGSLLIWFVLVAVLFRPIAFGCSASLNSICLGPNLFNQVLARINGHVLGHSISYFDDDFAGRISQKELQVARALVDVVQELISAIIFSVTMVLGTAALFGVMNPALLALLGFWFALYVIFLWYFLPRMRVRSSRRAAERANVTGQIVDTITNMRTVKLFAGTRREDDAAGLAMDAFRTAGIHWANLAALFRIGLVFLGGLLPVLLLGYGLWLWQADGLGAGALASIGALALRLGQMSGWVSWTMLGIFSNLGEIEDGIRTLAPDHSLVDQSSATDLEVSTPKIKFENVHFQYGLGHGGVTGINLDVRAGEKLALVGPSGAGKSTVMSLALRLYDPEGGRILVSDQDIASVKQESLREHISMVTQDSAMFNRSARDNILYGRADAGEEELVTASQKAEAHDFILELEDRNGRKGFDAHLGERGVKLSGGQRQRIALARAILKDAPILLLDEATSALDSEVEAQIQAALGRVMDGKTVIAIAHRLSTIARMDRIIVMDEGQIVEEGNHDDLLAKEGLYARLWAHQTGGFLNVDALKVS